MKNPDEVLSVFVTGLKNAHAMEKQALSILKPLASRIENYPDLKNRIERHITETEGQISRLETILDEVDEKHSGFKDAVLSMGGSMAALSHAAASDEILKDTFANYAFEHYEIAAYKSLIDLSRQLDGNTIWPLLEQNLQEEEEMANWIGDHIGAVTERYTELRSMDAQAKR
ncbi:ferritin-like domain-containing protein [Pelagibacterium limicola]|uniref:ferritin-like domain-containing protein n=1 Tax=Pelagibacterium limicola TaxID=2791022 RepID=UPI0018B00803|nr:ferritin-like domain-containing protein [Pelagibacterium limicola]